MHVQLVKSEYWIWAEDINTTEANTDKAQATFTELFILLSVFFDLPTH